MKEFMAWEHHSFTITMTLRSFMRTSLVPRARFKNTSKIGTSMREEWTVWWMA